MKQFIGDEHFHRHGVRENKTVLDFWRWYASNLAWGTLRGAVSEYVVSLALDVDTSLARDSFAEHDLDYRGYGIEVKSCSRSSSRIVFDIAPRSIYSQDAKWGVYKRHSHLYVFCLVESSADNPSELLDLERWAFWVSLTTALDSTFGARKTVTIKALDNKGAAVSCDFSGLREAVEDRLRHLKT
jgi:hypothetical protein